MLGMDWWSNNQAKKVIRIQTTNGGTTVIHGAGYAPTDYQALKIRKLSHNGCVALWAHVVDKGAEEPKLEDIPVIKEYPKAIPENLPELSTQ